MSALWPYSFELRIGCCSAWQCKPPGGVLLSVIPMWSSYQYGDFAGHASLSDFWGHLQWLVVIERRRKRQWSVGVPLDSFWKPGHKLGVLSCWLCASSLHYNILSQSRGGWSMLLEGLSFQEAWPFLSFHLEVWVHRCVNPQGLIFGSESSSWLQSLQGWVLLC